MIDRRTKKDLKDIPVLDGSQIYIYLMLNNVGKVKIGVTTNIQRRYQSLCGSNGQGNKILQVFCSEPTYVLSLESTVHVKFSKYRIPGTEWFYDKYDPTGEKLFLNAARELELLFSSASYKKCNDLRKTLYEKKMSKGGDTCDN